MKIEHVPFPNLFSKLQIRVSQGQLDCAHTIQFSEATKIGSLKSDSVNGPLQHVRVATHMDRKDLSFLQNKYIFQELTTNFALCVPEEVHLNVIKLRVVVVG